MAGIVVDKMGFWVCWFIILIIGTLAVKAFVFVEGEFDFKLEKVEDSVVVNRVVKCFSEEEFGMIDETKFNEASLRKCMGSKYNLKVDLRKLRGRDRHLEFGELGEFREINRYVIVDGGGARLEVGYSENVA
jgi:hypothetical protein